MSTIIKDSFKTKKEKAYAKYSITNGDGGLTQTGREEFVEYLFLTDKVLREGFDAKLLEKYEEDLKK